MTTYKNEVTWRDLQDKDYIYVEGKPYPREGAKPSKERIEELLSSGNLRKEPLISPVDGEMDFPKHTGGGYYELSNGEKVKDKEAAFEAESKIEAGDA